MKPLTDKQRARWEKTRRMGIRRYVLLYGMLLWGIPAGIVWVLAMSSGLGWYRLPILLLIALTVFPISGILFGRLMWRVLEARYAATPLPRKSKRRR
jgi:hypothetical protein